MAVGAILGAEAAAGDQRQGPRCPRRERLCMIVHRIGPSAYELISLGVIGRRGENHFLHNERIVSDLEPPSRLLVAAPSYRRVSTAFA